MRKKVLIIVGPTASGKSALAVALSKKFGGEVISADSRQVYRGLTIGTGKIKKSEMRGISHHLLDVASPKKKFSADDFITHGRKAIESIVKNGNLPIVAGGTGFYIDALTGRIPLPNVPPNRILRASLEKKTAKQLFAMLKRRDPRRAKTIDPNNKRRLIRALEIASSLGASPTPAKRLIYQTLWIGIAPTLPILEKRIQKRLHARLQHGMVREAQRLHSAGLSYKRMEELGLEYRSLARYLRKEITKQEMVAELERDIRRYAKKQLAYWKRNTNIQWFTPAETRALERAVKTWLQKNS